MCTVLCMFLNMILFNILSSSMASSVNVNRKSLFGAVKPGHIAEVCDLISSALTHLPTVDLLHLNLIAEVVKNFYLFHCDSPKF